MASARNLVVSWSDAVDSGGRHIYDYKLKFQSGILDWWSKICAEGAEFIWNIFMFFSAISVSLLKIVEDPKWMEGIDRSYTKLTSGLYAHLNPLYFAAIGLIILLLFVFLDGVKTNNARIDKNDLNRIGVGFGIAFGVAFLAVHPLYLVTKALSAVHTLVNAVTGTASETSRVYSVDSMIRQPTLIINYGGAVSEECADKWSRTGELTSASGCLDAGADTATVQTVILACISCTLSVAVLIFAALAAYKYAKHLLITVVGFVILPWVGAESIFRRRQFDHMGQTLAVAGGNLIMVIVVQGITVIFPTIVTSIMGDWGQSKWAIPQMIGLVIMYVILTIVLHVATKTTSPLVKALRASTDQAMTTYFSANTQWTSFNLDQAVTSGWNDMKNSAKKGVKAFKDGFNEGRGVTQEQDDLTDVQATINHANVMSPDGTVELTSLVDKQEKWAGLTQMSITKGNSTHAALTDAHLKHALESGTRITDEYSDVEHSVSDDSASVTVPVDSGNGVVVIDSDGNILNETDGGNGGENVRNVVLSAEKDVEEPLMGGRSPRTPDYHDLARYIFDEMQAAVRQLSHGLSPAAGLITMFGTGIAASNMAVVDSVDALNVNMHNAAATMLEAMNDKSSTRALLTELGGIWDSVARGSDLMSEVIAENSAVTINALSSGLAELSNTLEGSLSRLSREGGKNASRAVEAIEAVTSSIHATQRSINAARTEADERESSHLSRHTETARIARDSRDHLERLANSASLDRGDGVSPTVNVVHAGTTNVVQSTYPAIATTTHGMNALKGASATRGDVQMTHGTSLADAADIEQSVELAMKRAAAEGKAYRPNIPTSNVSFDIRFSPESTGGGVLPKVGVGFGDAIV